MGQAGLRGLVASEEAPRAKIGKVTQLNHDAFNVSRRSTKSSSAVIAGGELIRSYHLCDPDPMLEAARVLPIERGAALDVVKGVIAAHSLEKLTANASTFEGLHASARRFAMRSK
jgi:hypothetical protein